MSARSLVAASTSDINHDMAIPQCHLSMSNVNRQYCQKDLRRFTIVRNCQKFDMSKLSYLSKKIIFLCQNYKVCPYCKHLKKMSDIFSNHQKLSEVVKVARNCWSCQNFSKLPEIVKIARNCQSCQKLLKLSKKKQESKPDPGKLSQSPSWRHQLNWSKHARWNPGMMLSLLVSYHSNSFADLIWKILTNTIYPANTSKYIRPFDGK